MQDWRDFGWIYAPPKLLYGCGLANAKEVLLASETPEVTTLPCSLVPGCHLGRTAPFSTATAMTPGWQRTKDSRPGNFFSGHLSAMGPHWVDPHQNSLSVCSLSREVT